MTEKFISSIHVEKLSHKILEIRERALFNIISKLDHGFIYDNDLARSKEILQKLFEWFVLKPYSSEDSVLKLIKRILQTESGKILIKHLGAKNIISELKQIRTCLEQKHYPLIDDTLNHIKNEIEISTFVPPLESDIPLSYRTDQSGLTYDELQTVGTTATTIRGYVERNSSFEQQMGYAQKTPSESPKVVNENIHDDIIAANLYGLQNYTLNWQPLIAPDRHVLESVEESLNNPSQPSMLLHSCEFFTDVMLQDFPPEVFLQRPAIVLLFKDLLLSCTSTRISNAILNALLKLTKCLQIRINYFNDPSVQNGKQPILDKSGTEFSIPLSPLEDSTSSRQSNISDAFETNDEIAVLIKKQLPLPNFCFFVTECVFIYLKPDSQMKCKRTLVGSNIVFALFSEIIYLLQHCFKLENFQNESQAFSIIQKNFIEMLYKFADILEYFRLEVMVNDGNLNNRASHLQLLHICANVLKKFLPLNKVDFILPCNLKNALCNCLLDSALTQLYPKAHEIFLQYMEVESSRENDVLEKYKSIKTVCASMTASVKFLRNYKTLLTAETVELAKESLTSLVFHKNLKIVKIFIEICSNKIPSHLSDENLLNNVEDVILNLLSHDKIEIKLETYRLCQKRITAAIGTKLNATGSGISESQIIFLLRPKILNEIALHGITNEEIEIQKHSEDILVHILKCKILVSEDIWNKAVEALIPSLSILLCHANKSSSLGRTVINMLDPDIAQSFYLPTIEVLKGNARLLFIKEADVREEAVSRLCWLLASQPKSQDLLPKTNELYDKTLGCICLLERTIDINKTRSSQYFYQPSSLQQVLDLLNSPNTEPVIRRSALTQVSVMTEDSLLHRTFIEKDGLKTMKEIMSTALNEQDFTNYPDSVISVIAILKNISLYNSSARQEMSNDLELYYSVLRGLFLFFTEERLKHDASILLFLLLFNDCVRGTPSKADFSLYSLLFNKLNVPFTCTVHQSRKCLAFDLNGLLSDKYSLSSLQIHWNAEWYGGFKNVLMWDKVNYSEQDMLEFDEQLKMTDYDLFVLKCSSLEQCIKKYLNEVNDSSSHSIVITALSNLTCYINLFKLSKGNSDFGYEELLSLPWENSFAMFLNVLPSSENDVILLTHVIRFLCLLVPIYRETGKVCWISSILKDSSHCLPDLLQSDPCDTESKILNQELLNLVKICVCQEQHFLDFHSTYIKSAEICSTSWKNIIEIIADNLKFSDAQHFYNLAYLDCLLSCLVHLTATLGWSQSKTNLSTQKHFQQLVSGLSELIGSFHCSKGLSASVSVMGLSITRHVMLILNHLLVEMQNNLKDWEIYFLDENCESENIFANFCALWYSRDVVLRASVWQLFAGLCMKRKVAAELIQRLQQNKINIWEVVIKCILDNDEASIVRQNAVMLLVNLIGYILSMNNANSTNATNLDVKDQKEIESTVCAVLDLLNEYDFYKQLEVSLSSLYTHSTLNSSININNAEHTEKVKASNGECSQHFMKNIKLGTYRSLSSSSNSSKEYSILTTPGLIKAISLLLNNLLSFSIDEVSNALHEHGLIKMFFRSLSIPIINIVDTKELALYCDILEMNSAICSFLNKAVSNNSVCLGTILHTKDCLNMMFSLLDPSLYYTELPQLLYLRNKLWSEIFSLIAALLECGAFNEKTPNSRLIDAFNLIAGALNECGRQSFLITLCEAINSNNSFELQQSALTSLTSLLCVETNYTFDNVKMLSSNISETSSMQNLLDNVKTPYTVSEKSKDNLENIDPNVSSKKNVKILWDRKSQKDSDKYKMSLLENIYFGKGDSQITKDDCLLEKTENNQSLMVGAELCKILLQLYELADLKVDKNTDMKRKTAVFKALTSILCVSQEAKKYALQHGLLNIVLQQLKELHIKLSLESVDTLRRISEKKRVCPILKELNSLTGLLTNFMLGNKQIKCTASVLGLADLIHKLWIWICIQKTYLNDVLKLLCTFTNDCIEACQSLSLTSSLAGSGPRKVPSSMSLLHVIFSLISKEMEKVSCTHDLTTLKLCFHLLHNGCTAIECRVLLAKSNLLQHISRLHPAITKRQKLWENVELIWLDFLQTFTSYPEGQASVAKTSDVLELIMTFSSSTQSVNKQAALLVLRNIAFYQPNRSRLLATSEFLNILKTKLTNGNNDEKYVVVTIMWALAANSQKAKLVLKCAQLDVKLQEVIRRHSLENNAEPYQIKRMHYVLQLLRDGEKLDT